MKNKRLISVGFGVGIASAVVGVVAYQVGKNNKINNSHYDGRVIEKIEDMIDEVKCHIKK